MLLWFLKCPLRPFVPPFASSDDDSVMLTPCPDPDLAVFYEGLPVLRYVYCFFCFLSCFDCNFSFFFSCIYTPLFNSRVCDIKSFSGCTESARTPFAAMCEGLALETVKWVVPRLFLFGFLRHRFSTRSVLWALRFTKWGSYVNTARVDPALLRVINNRLRITDTKAMASCIMTGSITESFLIASAEAGPPHSPYSIHKITIAPFEQDFRRDTAVWGHLFDFHVISGMISSRGFSFTTRGEGKGDLLRPCECYLFIHRITCLILCC